MLRRLDFEGHRPDSSAPWLHQLHFINLTWGHNTLSVLSATRSLQELKVLWRNDDETPLSLTRVALPNLVQLTIGSRELSQIASVLDHLEIPPGCALHISTGSYQFHQIPKFLACCQYIITRRSALFSVISPKQDTL